MMTTTAYLWREGGAVKLANIVTLLRGIMILPIAGLLLEGARSLALGLYLLAVLTDGLDGWLARRSGRMSDFGATLDAVVDNVFALAIALFLWLAMPQVFMMHSLVLGLLFLVPLAYLALSWLMTGRVLMFHFQSARIGAVLLFALWPLLELTGAIWLIGLTAAVVTLSRAEQVVFILRGGRDQDARHGGQAIPIGVDT